MGVGCYTPNATTPNPTNASGTGQTEVNTEENSGILLATSPDNNFVVRGHGTCKGVFSIYRPTADETANQNEKGTLYNLGFQESADVPEVQDLGIVLVQTKVQYSANRPNDPYKVAFQTDQIIASASLTNAAQFYGETKQDCVVAVDQK